MGMIFQTRSGRGIKTVSYTHLNNDTTEVVITLDDGTSATFEVTTEDIGVDYGTIQTEMKSEASYDYSNLTFVCSTMGTLYGEMCIRDSGRALHRYLCDFQCHAVESIFAGGTDHGRFSLLRRSDAGEP